MRTLIVTTMVLVLAACAGNQSSPSASGMRQQFELELAALSGQSAKDCGHFGLNEDGKDVVLCVLAAREGGTAFRASAVRLGIDSLLRVGLAQNSAGELFEILGDSDVHGGGARTAKPAIFTWSCTDLEEVNSNAFLPRCVGREEI